MGFESGSLLPAVGCGLVARGLPGDGPGGPDEAGAGAQCWVEDLGKGRQRGVEEGSRKHRLPGPWLRGGTAFVGSVAGGGEKYSSLAQDQPGGRV